MSRTNMFVLIFTSVIVLTLPAVAQELGSTGASASTGNRAIVSPWQAQAPMFLLSHPASGRTDLPTEDFKLSWTRAPWARSFTVEVREDKAFGTGGAIITETVTGQTSFKVPKDKLKPGVRYFWQVSADCDPLRAACPAGGTVIALNGPFSFSTIRQLGFFSYLSGKGFSLQRVVSGDDESEGATFSFLRTFGKKTVYATDFALIWDSMERGRGNIRYSLESSVEGHLTSDESKAEDALRFGTGVEIINRFGNTGLKGLHSTLSAKLETDQRFTTKKLYFEALETLTAINLFIGRYSGEVNDPVQFRWRPFFGFQAGHTFKQGKAALPEDTILRLVPRARMDLKLNFISQALKIPRTLLFAENTFYYLPLERRMKTPDFFASGLEFDFKPNFGLTFNYKNGKTAPKFERVHTFGGAFTIRFGKNEQ